jgi:hypothetical protein
VQAYEKKAGVTLVNSEDSLAKRLQGCRSADDIATLLQGQAQAIDNFQQLDKIFKSIKIIVSILSPISSGASVADNVGLVRRKVRMACFTSLTVITDIPQITAINVTLGILLKVCAVLGSIPISF